MYMLTVFALNVNLSCELPSNFTNIFLSRYSSFAARLLLFTVEGLMTASDNPLDFPYKILLVLPIFLKHLLIV